MLTLAILWVTVQCTTLINGLWSSLKIFGLALKRGLAVPEVVQDYAKKVLAPGGTKAAADLAKDFLGRDYKMDAYKSWLSR